MTAPTDSGATGAVADRPRWSAARRSWTWLDARPWRLAALLGLLGLLFRQGWLSTNPLSSGDWKWPAAGRLAQWFPFPSVWTDTLGFSGQNRFEDTFRFPVYAVDGAIASAGESWTLIEKVVYFVPEAVLLPVAGWLVAREFLGRTRWTLLAPVLMCCNTYFLVEADGEIPLVLAEVIGCLALVAFMRTMRLRSVKWSLVTGLLLAVESAMDLRPAYLTILMIVGYLLLVAATGLGWRDAFTRLKLTALTGAVFVGTQLFWLLPLHFYGAHASFPTPPTPDFTIITLEHGISGVDAGWTGGQPAPFVEAPLNPMYMLLPLLAYIPLARRRLRIDYVWLILVAAICAFLAKTDNPPFGSVYNLLYRHFPGFNLFREGSKFLFPIGLAYAVLVPAALQFLHERAKALDFGPGRVATRLKRLPGAAVVGLLATVIVVSGCAAISLERGSLGSTTTPVAMPAAFHQLSSLLSSSRTKGPVLWFGGSVYTTGGAGEQKDHSYTITSAAHPIVPLTGEATSPVVDDRDDLQYFCATITDPYCYVTPQLFPYLTQSVGASYVISPDSLDLGLLPTGITPSWLRSQLTTILGTPTVLGTGDTKLLVWKLSGAPAVSTFPAVALVDSGPWSLQGVLPALEGLGVPAAYRQTFDAEDYPAAASDLADSISVVPSFDGSYQVPSGQSYAITMRSSAPTATVDVDGVSTVLPRLAGLTRSPGWTLYGPVSLSGGNHSLSAETGQPTPGPAVAWGALTVRTIGAPTSGSETVTTADNGERIVASGHADGPWAELLRTYDPGWKLHGERPTAVADGLFCLYGPAVTARSAKLAFTFSTMTWEHRGLALSILTALIALGWLWRRWRRERRQDTLVLASEEPYLEGGLAQWLGGAVFLILGLAGLAVFSNWYGLPSRLPTLTVTGDPYKAVITLSSLALLLVVLSLAARLLRLIPWRRRARGTSNPVRTARARRKVAALAGTAMIAVGLTGCHSASHNESGSLANAEAAGETPQSISGATLYAARIAQGAINPTRCIDDYTIALRALPTLVDAFVGRGVCYESYGFDPQAAVRDFTRALTLQPYDEDAVLDLGGADQAIGDVTAAASAYERAIAIPGATPVDALDAIDSLEGMGDTAQAAGAVTRAEQLFPTSSYTQVAQADVDLGRDDDAGALAALSQAQQEAISSVDPAQIATVAGRICNYDVEHFEYSQAIPVCQQSANAQPGDSGAFDNLAAAESGLGDLQAALSDMSSAIGAFEGNVGPNAQPGGVDGFGLAYLLEAQGRLLVELHQPRAAVAEYRRAVKALPPGSPDFVARLHGDIKAAEVD